MKENMFFVLLLAMLLTFTSCAREVPEHPALTHTPVDRVQVTAEPRENADISKYYRQNYPMTYGYIRKNADNPAEYIRYYDSVWGKLQRYLGDGIPFHTLTSAERKLVNYPSIGTYVYFSSSTSKTYHSIMECYSLLKSEDIVSRPSLSRYNYSPCSKCVDE